MIGHRAGPCHLPRQQVADVGAERVRKSVKLMQRDTLAPRFDIGDRGPGQPDGAGDLRLAQSQPITVASDQLPKVPVKF